MTSYIKKSNISFDYQENENIPLNIKEDIAILNKKKRKKSKNEYSKYLDIIFMIIFFITFVFSIYLFLNLDNNPKQSLNELPIPVNNSILNDSTLNTTKDNKTLGIAILYSCLFGNGIARFMMVTGEYFIKKGYNVYFITKTPYKNDFKFNPKIKRIYGLGNQTLIDKTLKTENIDFLILNNIFSPSDINYYKSFGIKVIGIYHGVYISAMFNNYTLFYRSWKNTELFDAYIHIGADDYYFFKHFDFKRNIFIPNLYTFDPAEVPSSNLTYHNMMMLGRLNDHKKGVIYAIKAMSLIVKEVPDVRLNLVSSDSRVHQFKNITIELNLTNNIFFIPYTENISNYLLNSSVFFFTSLTEAFPMALNEAKAYGLPCVTFDISYSIPFQSGVIKVDMFDYKALAKEAIKLLKDYDYRVKMGKEAKLSLNKFTNEGTTNLWGRLFNALKNGEDEFQKLRTEIQNKYYDENSAEMHMKKQLNYLKAYNNFFSCHSFQNLSNINYINNIEECKNISRII